MGGLWKRILAVFISMSFVATCSTALVGIVIVGRNDVPTTVYQTLAESIRTEVVTQYNVSVIVVISVDDQINVAAAVANLTSLGASQFFFVGHSMSAGGVTVQNYASSASVKTLGVILISAFLQRTYRPDVVECLKKASLQPQITWSYPLGYLADGSHDCYGANVPTYPVPVLTIGGELDGVVRLTRIAEAYYTQVVLGENHVNQPVVIVPSLNHASLLDTNALPSAVIKNDLRSELTPLQARSEVSHLVSLFVGQQLHLNDGSELAKYVTNTAEYLKNIINAFVVQEGNWFFTGGDDEHGSSEWAAQAQIDMSSPLPSPYNWVLYNQFRLLSDEESIPPYYRPKHRPELEVLGTTLNSSTVSQLRFIELTLVEVDAGLNGWAIIKEEKLNILTALPDDGSVFVSAIEIATKLMSRQKVFNLTGHDSPESLDDGDRCASINALAYDWALSQLPSTVSVDRWSKYGVPFVMGTDEKPFPEAGPFWIWKYMSYTPSAQPQQVAVGAPYAFFSLSANPYGAGNHYCKLLSPARVLEWMLVDGLRQNYGLL